MKYTNKMYGQVIINVGSPGTGKTHLCKDYIEIVKKQPLVYATLEKDFSFPIIDDENLFWELASKRKDTCILADEAETTIKKLDPQRTANKLVQLQVKCFGNARKLNNLYLINFHALGQIPEWLLDCGVVTIINRFQTVDKIQKQIRRFESFPSLVQSLEEFPTIDKYTYDAIVLRKLEG